LVLQSLGDARAVPALRALLLDGSEQDSLRDQAARALIELHAPDARDLLERLLFEPTLSDALRREVAMRLFDLHDHASLPALERALKSYHQPELSSALCLSFGAFGDKSHVPLLQGELKKMTDELAQQSCREAIDDIEARP
jgi:HEAT repeat protein